ncbi:hypothetical protein KZZ52_02485 [Dactylosporangium sp. AC04546]|uniref:hypothetical protein n=1 Tax=Dactylosporangium sp. AC04546 TaxID=2862460 RepID=UPI001EE0D911|nr:hypothetical protein [Dactylosporangium sp. AC04546]WVK84322.1 hypothetical protein KZZ52_02485 [Dactylosporangium sp. AC04546]
MHDLLPEDLKPIPDHVASLLAAAAAPARPHELAGEDAAVAGYRRVYGTARPPGRRRRLAVLATLTAVGVSFGSAAYAASTGRLPDPIQRTVHSFVDGVPAPAVAEPPPTPASTGPRPSPASADILALCHAWEAFRADPHSPPVTGADRRRLADAAGGERFVTDYCRQLLSGPSTAASASSSASPSVSTSASTKPGNPSPGVPNGKKPSHTSR